jgi:hypothetical protein
MKDFSAFSVSNYFGFEPRVDEELQPGIMISKPVGGGAGRGGSGSKGARQEGGGGSATRPAGSRLA